jgi:hypothetical protein
MKTQFAWLALVGMLLTIGGPAYGQERPGCEGAQFSNEILGRFPDAEEACLDVISRGGQDYAVFKVQLDRVRGNTLDVRFQKPDGSRGPRTSITAQPDFRVLVDGKPTAVRNLAANQELTAYVRVDRPMMALEPATPTQVWNVVPVVLVPASEGNEPTDDGGQLAMAEQDPAMPDTAGPAPLVAGVGLFFIMAALGARAVRGVRSLRRKRMARIPTPA